MKFKKVFLFACLASIYLISNAQDEKFKAIFMYNFTKYIEWPSSKKNQDFVIGIFGNSPIENELTIIAEKKRVGSQKIVVRKINAVAQCSQCNIVYVPENKSSKLSEINSACKGKGTVIICDKPGLAKTIAGLNYVKVNGKQSFEINKTNLTNQGVKVNSVLFSLGINVE